MVGFWENRKKPQCDDEVTLSMMPTVTLKEEQLIYSIFECRPHRNKKKHLDVKKVGQEARDK